MGASRVPSRARARRLVAASAPPPFRGAHPATGPAKAAQGRAARARRAAGPAQPPRPRPRVRSTTPACAAPAAALAPALPGAPRQPIARRRNVACRNSAGVAELAATRPLSLPLALPPSPPARPPPVQSPPARRSIEPSTRRRGPGHERRVANARSGGLARVSPGPGVTRAASACRGLGRVLDTQLRAETEGGD